MSKVFRLYKNGDNTFTDWHESASFPYNSENRDGKNGIDDPAGASSKNEITSIPSPFARIDLVKTAFVRVCQPDVETKKVNLDGNTIFHICGSCEEDRYAEVLRCAENEGYVRYHGEAKDMSSYLGISHCLIHPSL